MHLRPEHMRLIAPHINLDFDRDLMEYRPNVPKQLLMDEGFGYKDGLHEPMRVLLLGFMYCQMTDPDAHMDNLWHLMNPNFKKSVNMQVIEKTLKDLLYIAIDQRLKMLMDDENSTDAQRRYLEQCESMKSIFIAKVCNDLATDTNPEGSGHGSRVTYEQFKNVFNVGYARPVNLRALVLFKTKNAEMTLSKPADVSVRSNSIRPD